MKIYEGMIIVTDLDGTFLGRGECVPERNLRAVAEFVEKGGRFTVSTGRMMVDLDRALPDAVHLCNAPLITSNGALIYDAVQQRVLSEHPMDKADTLAVLQWLRVRFPTTGCHKPRCADRRRRCRNRAGYCTLQGRADPDSVAGGLGFGRS